MDNAIAQDACIISPDSETRHEGDCDGASRPFLSSSTHEETGNTPPKLGSNYRWAKGSKLYRAPPAFTLSDGILKTNTRFPKFSGQRFRIASITKPKEPEITHTL